MKKHLLLATVLMLSVIGCASMSRTQKGAVIGGSSGAVIGGVLGKQAGNTAMGALIGAAVGGAAGAYIGNYMDDQAAELERDLEGAKIERVGEGIKITFDSGILFAVNQADLQPAAKSNLTNLAVILRKYDDTNILVEGHTDADGTAAHNLTLSERRARSVSAELAVGSVPTSRVTIIGYGESQPVADNTSDWGKQQNRRVEIAIMANDDLKKAAERKEG